MKDVDTTMKKELEHLWTIDDVAEFCRVKPSVVKYWVRNSDIPIIKLGKQIRFNPEDVREWIQRKRNDIKEVGWELRGVK